MINEKKYKFFLILRLQGLISLMRPRQWVKNTFVLAPLLFSGSFLQFQQISQASMAMLLFCMASSAAYIVNDIYDLERDRLHPKKSKTRPLAAGLISIPLAFFLLLSIYALLLCAWLVMQKVMIVIVIYIFLNLAYTFFLKHQPVVDIFTIAIGFVLRVCAGAIAIEVPISSWMCVSTLCLALYLAAIKRRQELNQNGIDGRKVLEAYSVKLVDRYAEMSATGALLFYSMFVMSSKTELVITIPLVLFGLFRYWFVVETLDGGESPTDALLEDWQLLFTVVLWGGACCWALLPVQGRL
jgi:4-hydroxybenzoate polyprenyltransferase